MSGAATRRSRSGPSGFSADWISHGAAAKQPVRMNASERISELCSIRLEQLHLDAGFVTVIGKVAPGRGWEDALEAVLRERLNGIAQRAHDNGVEDLRKGTRPGGTLGLVSVVAQRPFPFSVTAAGPCTTRLYDAQQLLALMHSDGEVALDLANSIGNEDRFDIVQHLPRVRPATPAFAAA